VLHLYLIFFMRIIWDDILPLAITEVFYHLPFFTHAGVQRSLVLLMHIFFFFFLFLISFFIFKKCQQQQQKLLGGGIRLRQVSLKIYSWFSHLSST